MNMFIIVLFLAILYCLIDLKKALHMLQQNWYNDGNRYLKWIFANKKFIFFWFDLLFIFVVLLGFINNKILNIGMILYYLVIIILLLNKYKNEQKKKKLVFTSRVKRICLTTFILYFIPIYLMLKNFNGNLILYYFILGVLVYFNYFIVLIANIINIPVEKMVYLYYKNKATKKLKSLNNMDVIGITGSYGKTSTKNIVSDILNVKYIAFPTPQNFNTNYGIIRTINEYIDKYNNYFIAELGAFRKGDIKSLTNLVHPKYGILTKIGTAHLDTFGCIENTCKTKFELIESLPSDGIGFLNMDDELQVNYKLKNNIKIVWYGFNKKADVYASNIKYSSEGMSFDVHYKTKEKFNVTTRLLGEANVYNILAGIAVSKELGLSIEQIKQGVLQIKPIEHRLQLKKYGKINYIDDAYNSNPVGSKMALDTLKLMPGKKIVITPGMIEMGSIQSELNYNFGKQIGESVDLAILVGKEQTKPIQEGIKSTKFNQQNLIVVNDVKDAINIAKTYYKGEETYILLENDLPDLFNEK